MTRVPAPPPAATDGFRPLPAWADVIAARLPGSYWRAVRRSTLCALTLGAVLSLAAAVPVALVLPSLAWRTAGMLVAMLSAFAMTNAIGFLDGVMGEAADREAARAAGEPADAG